MSITKRLFLSALNCPTLAWLTNSGQYTKPVSVADQFNMEEGLEVHKRAIALFPKGYSINQTDILAAANKTKELLADKNTSVIFEATFLAENYITRADILKREESSWKIFEIKSSVNDRDEFIDDMAYTVMVLQKAGLKIIACSLLLISKDYRLGMSDEQLFKEIDRTQEVLKKAEELNLCSEEISQKLFQDEKPGPELKWECKGCEIFEECCGQGIKNHIFDLPRLYRTKFCSLIDLRVLRIEDIPDDFKLTENQMKVRDAVKSGQPIIRDGLREALNQISFPAYYLDFETVNTAIPLYPAVAPFIQIPVEYSIHKCSAPGKVMEHFKYLAGPARDCRRELAKSLTTNCGKKGTIFSYSPFEKTIINGLIQLFPGLAENLQGLITRLVDLKEILSDYFYHPDFHGSYSIKNVLPVLVPELTYEGMNIADGRDAMAVFAYLARGRYSREEKDKVRKDLLEYCKMDSLAMVKLHERLETQAHAE